MKSLVLIINTLFGVTFIKFCVFHMMRQQMWLTIFCKKLTSLECFNASLCFFIGAIAHVVDLHDVAACLLGVAACLLAVAVCLLVVAAIVGRPRTVPVRKCHILMGEVLCSFLLSPFHAHVCNMLQACSI